MREFQEIAANEVSEGLPDDDPMLWDREDEEESSSSSEEDYEPNPRDLRWEEVDDNWAPNWLMNYNQEQGFSAHYPGGLVDPIDFFQLLFDDEVINLLVLETNRYAEQFFTNFPGRLSEKYYQEWQPCTPARMKAYLGILIHMGLSQLHHMQSHWENSVHYSCSFCPNVMTRNEFTLLHKFFHIVNNQNANQDDRLYKIRPLFNLMVSKFQRYYVLSKDITIDERIVKYTGRLIFRQYIRNKPIKLGIKVFLLSDSLNGYIYNWEVYCGAGQRLDNASLAHEVITRLVEGLHNRGHLVCFDSYYTNVPTVKYLATRGFGCLGMLRQNRKFIPQVIKRPQEPLEPGEALFRRSGNLLCFIFKDKKEIRMLTNVYGNAFNGNGKPQALFDYNFLMRGVDKSNQSNSYYHFRHKSIKWYKTLFISVLESTVSNAYQLYKLRFPLTGKKPLMFRESLATDLAQEYITQKHRRLLLSSNLRIIPGLHEISTRNQKNCFICSTNESRKTTIYYCIECDKNVCPSRCFYILHTKLHIQQRNKIVNSQRE